MRRAVAAIVATLAGLVLLLSYKTSPSATVRPTATSSAAPQTPAAPASGSPPPTPRTGLSTTLPRTATTKAPASAAARSGTFTGPVVTTRYGPVQVAVTLKSDRITDVRADALPSDRARSASLSDLAAPILRSEALAAQGAQIDSVSGASITSRAYAQSLQAAIDAAHA